MKGNGHFSSEADTIVGFDNDEEAGPSRNGENGHVDNHPPFNGQLDGTNVPRLAPSHPHHCDLPPLLGSPTPSQWLDLNAPNVSPATGAVIGSPGPVPPLDLRTRLQHEQVELALQHLSATHPGISIRDFATLSGPVQAPDPQMFSQLSRLDPDNVDGALPTVPGYEDDTDSPDD